MPVVNDFPGLYEKTRAYADAMAQSMRLPPQAIYAFFNKKGGHFPQSLQELNSFLDEPDPTYGYSRRDPATGALRFIGGGQKTPGLTDVQRGGFAGHFQHNADDYDIERFQQVDPSGTVFGGSWDNAYNQAHPELAGKSGFDTPLGQGAGLAGALGRVPVADPRAAGGTARLASNVAGGSGGPTPEDVANAAAVQPWQRRQIEDSNGWAPGSLGGADAAPGAAPSSPSSPSAPSSPSSPGSSPATYQGSDTGSNLAANDSLARAIEAARRLAFDQAKLALDREQGIMRDDREKERIALLAADQAQRAVQDKAVATGVYPDGTPTLAAGQQGADLTGYDPSSSITARAVAGWKAAKAANPTITGTGPEAVAIWQSLIPGMTAEQAQAMANAASQYSTANGANMPEDIARTTLGQITGRPASSFGVQTPGAIHLQNQDAARMLEILANLRGPENAFAYAQTLANVPESIRGAVQAAVSRMPVAGANPAQTGVLGDLGAGQPAAVPTAQALPPSHAAVAAGSGTVQGGSAMQAAPGLLPQTSAAWQAGAAGQPSVAPGATPVGQIAPADPLTAQLAVMPVRGPGVQPVPAQPGMIAPNQLSPTDMGRTPTYLKELLWSGYEAVGPDGKGMDRKDAQERYLKSLPVASGPKTGRYRAA